MSAMELFQKDGKSAGIFYCSTCRCVAKTQGEAERCCQPYKCQKCGKECEKYWTICTECRKKEEAEKEQKRFDAATKIPAAEYSGWLYFTDKFYEGVEQLLEDNPDDSPEWAWACTANHFARVDVDDTLQRIAEDEDAYEDFDSSDLRGIDELTAAVDAFNKANEGVVSYSPDFTRAVML